MKCAFIMKDFTIEYRELDADARLELSNNNRYFSINMNDENMIYVSNDIYTDANMEKIIPLMLRANKELMFE